MKPPEASGENTESAPQAVHCVLKLKKRADFVALNRARRQVTPTMMVQR